MILAVLLVAAQSAPGVLESRLVPVPAALAPIFARMVERIPDFRAVPGRVLQPGLRGAPPDPNGPPAWVVECRWKEKGALRTGVVMIMDVPAWAASRGETEAEVGSYVVRDGIWGASTFIEDVTYAQWLDKVIEARGQAVQAAALSDLRQVVSAEEDFKAASGGGYADEECLAHPTSCVPGAPPDAFASGLDERLARHPIAYRRTFHSGPALPAVRGRASRLLSTWAVTYRPTDDGLRSYCADSAGTVCATAPDVAMPPLAGAACPQACPAWP